jgi:hypothetical protein
LKLEVNANDIVQGLVEPGGCGSCSGPNMNLRPGICGIVEVGCLSPGDPAADALREGDSLLSFRDFEHDLPVDGNDVEIPAGEVANASVG